MTTLSSAADLISNKLKRKIVNAKDIADLNPFIRQLLNIEDIKQQLILKLNQLQPNQQNINKLRSLYSQTYSFNGTPSDIMHANIISYLPSTDYIKLPLVSKQFRKIMYNYPFIFNEKGYSVDIDIHNYDNNVFESGKGPTQIKIWFDHWSKKVKIKDEPSDTKSGVPFTNETEIPINHIKYWAISRDLPKEIYRNLSKVQNIIHKLQISDDSSDKIANTEWPWKFKNCHCLSMTVFQHSAILCNTPLFCNLQCLEISAYLCDSNKIILQTKQFVDGLNQMLSYLSQSLKCFSIMIEKRIPLELRFADSETDNKGDIDPVQFDSIKLDIPLNVEWLQLQGPFEELICKVDLSKCNKMIGMYLERGIQQNDIIWPKEYVIPFVYFGTDQWNHTEIINFTTDSIDESASPNDNNDDNNQPNNNAFTWPPNNNSIQWNFHDNNNDFHFQSTSLTEISVSSPINATSRYYRINEDNIPNIRFIKFDRSHNVYDSYRYSSKTMKEIWLELKGNTQNITNKSLLCVVLADGEWSDDKMSFCEKLLEYCFDDAHLRRQKIEEYKRLWSLQSASWMKKHWNPWEALLR